MSGTKSCWHVLSCGLGLPLLFPSQWAEKNCHQNSIFYHLCVALDSDLPGLKFLTRTPADRVLNWAAFRWIFPPVDCPEVEHRGKLRPLAVSLSNLSDGGARFLDLRVKPVVEIGRDEAAGRRLPAPCPEEVVVLDLVGPRALLSRRADLVCGSTQSQRRSDHKVLIRGKLFCRLFLELAIPIWLHFSVLIYACFCNRGSAWKSLLVVYFCIKSRIELSWIEMYWRCH